MSAMERGFTLVETVMVVFLLSLLALLAVRHYGGLRESAERTAAQTDLATLRDAIVGTPVAPGYLGDMETVPGFMPVNPLWKQTRFECLNLRVHNLFCPSNLQSEVELAGWRNAGLPQPQTVLYDINSGRGWRGPYVGGGRRMDAERSASAVRPPPPPNASDPGFSPPARFPRRGRFPGPDDVRFAKDRTFFQRGFYAVNDLVPGSSYYGFVGEEALADPWGNPYVIQVPAPEAFPDRMRPTAAVDKGFAKLRWRYARLVSAGPDGVLDTPRDLCAGRSEESTAARGDDLVLFLNRADTYEELK